MFCPDLYAEHVYPFQGHLDLADKNFTFSVKLDEDAALSLNVGRKDDDVYQAVLNVQNLATPLFDMTTEIQSVVNVHRQNNQIDRLSGSFLSQYSLIDRRSIPEMSGRFELKDGSLHVDNVVMGNFNGEGSVGLLAPHNLDAAIAFDGVGLEDFLGWLSSGQKKLTGSGLLSGQINLGGTPQKLSVKSTITSDGGYIESLRYDHMALHLQGIYPLVDLTNSTITKTNGFSFDLDGKVDLSDKANMTSQIALIKTVPLVSANHEQSEWVLKRVQDEDGNNVETKYFIKKDKGVGSPGSDPNDYGVFGVERNIGF